jgi:CHASE2 domain-containing sensor protein
MKNCILAFLTVFAVFLGAMFFTSYLAFHIVWNWWDTPLMVLMGIADYVIWGITLEGLKTVLRRILE